MRQATRSILPQHLLDFFLTSTSCHDASVARFRQPAQDGFVGRLRSRGIHLRRGPKEPSLPGATLLRPSHLAGRLQIRWRDPGASPFLPDCLAGSRCKGSMVLLSRSCAIVAAEARACFKSAKRHVVLHRRVSLGPVLQRSQQLLCYVVGEEGRVVTAESLHGSRAANSSAVAARSLRSSRTRACTKSSGAR